MPDPSDVLDPAQDQPEPQMTSKREWKDGLRQLSPGRLVPWIPVVLFVACTVVVLYVGKVFLDRASDEINPLSNLEQTFFGAYTLIVGGAISWVISHVYARRETRDRFEQLARPALRRVVAARESAEGLIAAVDRRQLATGATEAFESLRELVDQHARTLDDAISDWQELLPAEVVQAQQEAALGAQTRRETELRGIKKQLAALEERQQAEQPPDPEVAALRKVVERLSADVEASRSTGFTAGRIHTFKTAVASPTGEWNIVPSKSEFRLSPLSPD